VDFFRGVFDAVPEFIHELEKNNLEPIFLSTGYPVGFFTTEPLTNLDEIEGKKWRAVNHWDISHFEEAGAELVKQRWGTEIFTMLKN
jgi:hypothetical protein